MEIIYSLTEEDLLAFTKYRAERIPALKKRARRTRFGYTIGFALMALGLWAVTSDLNLFFIFVFLSVLSFVFFPQYYQWRLRRRVSESYRDDKFLATLGRRKLKIGPEGLEEDSSFGEMKINWDVVDDVIVTPSYAFISIQQTPAIIISKDRVTEGNYEGFITAIKSHLQLTDK